MNKNKGLTLVELIVSVALISIVIVFLFQLLIELRYQNLNDTSKVEYKVAASLITKKIQNVLMEEEVDLIATCDETNTCLKITFVSDSYLEIKIQSDNKVLSIIKKDSEDNIIMEDTRQIPEKDETGYLGSFDNLFYTTSAFTPTNSGYDYRYDSLLKIEFVMYDSLNNEYPIVAYYPYVGGGDFSSVNYTLTVVLDGGTWNGTTPQTIASGNSVTLNDPTKSGYTFTGWTVSGEGSSIDGTTFTMGLDDTNIVANWLLYANMYSYTGTNTLIDDGDGNWRIKFLTNGTFTPLTDMIIDVFLVGGGGSGGSGSNSYGGGGGGGYTTNQSQISLNQNTAYSIVIGSGGIGSSATGGLTSAFSYTALGGSGGANNTGIGGSGGSGGGSYNTAGSSDGANGQGTTTREFGELTGALYAGGGGGPARYNTTLGGSGGGGQSGCAEPAVSPTIGTANTGGGGGGAGSYSSLAGANGGSGIVVIRNHR